jgi:hypothetical protein
MMVVSNSGRAGARSRTRGEDLDALDRIDAEVGVERHPRFEHLGGIAGLLGDEPSSRRGDQENCQLSENCQVNGMQAFSR